MAIRPAQNVIQLFGICDDAVDGKVRIVMELCTHGSLRDFVKALPPSQVCARFFYWVVSPSDGVLALAVVLPCRRRVLP